MIKAVIVEDDLMVAAINREFALKTPELDIVATFHNGRDALEFLQQSPPELLLLDIYMPDVSGLDLLAELRRQGNGTEAILITAANDVDRVERALHLGVVDYLVKPFTYERFQEAMNKFLLRRSLKMKGTYTQTDIDQLIHAGRKPGRAPQIELEKGMQQQTMERILDCFRREEHQHQYLTCEQLAAETNLSKVTTRRYMNYLVERQKAVSRVNYATGGRPSIEYAMMDRWELI